MTVNARRIVRHLSMTNWRVKAAFHPKALTTIRDAIQDSHKTHIGQVQFVVEGALHSAALIDGMTARERAIDVFSQLRVWDTEYNNGILIYLLLADRDVEIIADRGIHSRVRATDWEAICGLMEAHFRCGEFELGTLRGVEKITKLLRAHFPTYPPPDQELSASPVVM